MEVRLPPDREAHLTALAAESGLSTEEIVEEAVALWEAHQAQRARSQAKHTPAQAAARIRELRKGNKLPDGETIEDVIHDGRA